MNVTMKSASTPAFLLAGLFYLSGCSLMSHTQNSGSLFTLEPGETKKYRALLREHDSHAAACTQDHSCDRVHFTHALIALHENKEAAGQHFREVMTVAPSGELANLSANWLRYLEAPSEQKGNSVLAQTTHWLLLDLLSREQKLRHELSMRDKRLEELSRQLKALKQIDLEMKEKHAQIKPKAKLLRETDDGQGP
jgi:hypothetical protein